LSNGSLSRYIHDRSDSAIEVCEPIRVTLDCRLESFRGELEADFANLMYDSFDVDFLCERKL